MSYNPEKQLELYISNTEVHSHTPIDFDNSYTIEKIPSLLQFTQAHYKRIWDTDSHRKESLAKIVRLSEFADNEFRPITQYRPSYIYDFLEHRREDFGNKEGTLNRYIACLSKIFRFYEDEYNVQIAPRLRYRRDPNSRGRPRVFSKVEQSQILEMLSTSEYPWAAHMVTFALKSGMRKGEILGIGKTAAEVKRDEVYGRIMSEGGLHKIHLYSTKNGDERIVPLQPAAWAALQALKERPSTDFDHHQFYRVWDRVRRRLAPNDEHFVFHVCRHTAATDLALKGFNMKQIGDFLGHKAIVTTAKYIKSTEESTHEMAMAL